MSFVLLAKHLIDSDVGCHSRVAMHFLSYPHEHTSAFSNNTEASSAGAISSVNVSLQHHSVALLLWVCISFRGRHFSPKTNSLLGRSLYPASVSIRKWYFGSLMQVLDQICPTSGPRSPSGFQVPPPFSGFHLLPLPPGGQGRVV